MTRPFSVNDSSSDSSPPDVSIWGYYFFTIPPGHAIKTLPSFHKSELNFCSLYQSSIPDGKITFLFWVVQAFLYNTKLKPTVKEVFIEEENEDNSVSTLLQYLDSKPL